MALQYISANPLCLDQTHPFFHRRVIAIVPCCHFCIGTHVPEQIMHSLFIAIKQARFFMVRQNATKLAAQVNKKERSKGGDYLLPIRGSKVYLINEHVTIFLLTAIEKYKEEEQCLCSVLLVIFEMPLYIARLLAQVGGREAWLP